MNTAEETHTEQIKKEVAVKALKKIQDVMNREPKSYGAKEQRRMDRQEISDIINETLLIIK